MSLLQPVKAESLSTQVADTIRAAIFNRELLPGQVIRELALAKSLQVSQATVREALAQLESYGLVVRTPNRSTAVSSLSEAEVRDRLAVRLNLETLAFEQAVQFVTDEEIGGLRSLADHFLEVRDKGDVASVVGAERAFFQKAWQLSRNPVLARILDQLTTPLYAIWTDRHPASEHLVQGLLTALAGRNPEGIREALEQRPLAEGASAGDTSTH
jgi:DNA-binding GntR family transcriptional regulator